jgi:hypothetical protein
MNNHHTSLKMPARRTKSPRNSADWENAAPNVERKIGKKNSANPKFSTSPVK